MSIKMKANCQSTERKTLHLLMRSEENIELSMAMGLTDEEFSIARHQLIYDGIINFYTNHEVNVLDDIDLLVNSMEYDDIEDKKQTVLLIHKLSTLKTNSGAVIQDKYLKAYIKNLRDMKLIRDVVKSVQGITRCLGNENGTVDELMETIVEMDTILSSSNAVTISRFTQEVVVKDTVRALLEESECEGKVKFYLDELDKNCKIIPGYLTYIAADSGVGKSTALLNLAYEQAGRGVGVGYFSLEMNKEDNMKRMFCMQEGILSQHLLIPKLMTNKDWQSIDEIMEGALPKMNIQWYCESSVDIDELSREITRMVKVHNVDTILIDYYQLLDYEKNDGLSDSIRIPLISRNLAVLAAKEYVNPFGKRKKISIVALSQVTKDVLRRDDKHPTLHDLYFGGYKDARLVVGLYRDEYYHPEETNKEGIIEYGIIKQNNGLMDVWFDAKFEGDTFKIRDLTSNERDAIEELSDYEDEEDYDYEDEESAV